MAVARRQLRRPVRTLVYGLYGTFASAFVLSSTVQIFTAALGCHRPASSARAPALTAPCADGIRGLRRALDRARRRADDSDDENHASDAFRAALAPEWGAAEAVEAACRASPRGLDAFAVLVRLRRSDEAYARRGAAVLAPLRRELESYEIAP